MEIKQIVISSTDVVLGVGDDDKMYWWEQASGTWQPYEINPIERRESYRPPRDFERKGPWVGKRRKD